MKALILITAIAVLTSCADGEKNSQTGGQNVQPQCAGLTLVGRTTSNPSLKGKGFVNNVLAFDECAGNANGFSFSRTNVGGGTYELLLTNPTFPYPQPGHQVNLRLEVYAMCGTPMVQSASRTIPLEDRGGCYFATYTP